MRTRQMQSWLRTVTPASTLLTLLVSLSACQTARMPVAESLAAADPMPVSGRQGLKLNERLRFGPYEVHSVQRSWTRGRDRQVSVLTASDRGQNFAFTMRDGADDQWRAVCRHELYNSSIDLRVVEVEHRNQSGFECMLEDLRVPGGAWRLTLTERGERPLSGTLTSSSDTLRVVGTNRLDGAVRTGATTGYQIEQDGGYTLAAVEVINSGSVRLGSGLDSSTRSLLAAAASALLLLEDLRETLNTPSGSS